MDSRDNFENIIQQPHSRQNFVLKLRWVWPISYMDGS